MDDEIEIDGHRVKMTAALHAIAQRMLEKGLSGFSVEHGGFRAAVSILPNPKSSDVHEADHECA